MNDPVDEETALIKKSQIKYYGSGEDVQLPENTVNFTVCDPAVSQKETADYSSITTVSIDWQNNWYVRETRRGRWTVGELLTEMFSAYSRWKPMTMSIEVIGQAQAIMEAVQNEEERRRVYLPIEEIKSRGMVSKEARIRSVLQPRFERGKIFITREMVDLEEELLRFPKSAHDDIVDSLTDVETIGFTPDKLDQPKDQLTGFFGSHIEKFLNRNKKPVDEVLGEHY